MVYDSTDLRHHVSKSDLGGLSLRENISWTALSNIIYGFSQLYFVLLVARIGGTHAVGYYSLALGTVVPIQMLFNLQLRALLASDAKQEFTFSTYFLVRLGGICATIVLVALVLLFGEFSHVLIGTILGVTSIKIIESVADVLHGAMQKRERLDIPAKSRLIESLLGLLAFTLIYATTRSILLALVTVAIVAGSVLLFYIIPQSIKLDVDLSLLSLREVDLGSVRRLIGLGMPLGITLSLLNVSSVLPRFTLEYFGSVSDVGVYAAFSQLIAVGVIATGAVGQSLTPKLSQMSAAGHFSSFRRILRRLYFVSFCISITGTLIAWILGSKILSTLYSAEFAAHDRVLILMAISSAFIFSASFQGYALTAARIIRPQVIMFALVIVVNLALLIALVPHWGLYGAALSATAGAICQLVIGRALLDEGLDKLGMKNAPRYQ